MTSAKFKRNAKRIKDAIAAKTEPKQNTSIGGAVGSTKLFIGGQIFQGSITGTQEVVNAGRPAAARYVPKNGGGTTIISSSGSSVSTGGSGGGDTGGGYLPLSGIYPMTGSLDMGENSIINVQMVDGRDLQADGTLLDGLKNADVITLSTNANFVNERVLTFGTGFTTVDGGAGNPFTVTIPTPPTLSVSSVSSDITRSHAITTSNAPGAAASILASSASGVLTLPQFIATTKVTTPVVDTASGDLSLAPVGDVVTLKNVGIGTTPSLPLDVSKTGTSVTIDGVTDYEDIIGARSSGGRGLRLGSNDTASYIRTSFSGTDLILATRVSPDNIERVRIKAAGNVLIGTSTDSGYKLDVSGTMRATTSLTTPLITTATNIDLVINPAGTGAVQFPNDQKLRTSSFDSSFPINGWQINEVEGISGYSAFTIGKIQADELAVRVFVADEVRVDRGDEFWTKSYGIVAETFTTPGSIGGTVSVMFEDSPALTGAIFTNDDWVLFRKLEIDSGLDLFNVWGQVSSYVDNGDGTQNWTFTLRSGPTGGKDIIKGSLAIDFGASGAALIHLSVIDAAGAPYIKMRKWVTNPYTPANFKTYVQLGNLGSIGNSYVTPAGYGIYIGSTAGDERFLLADDNGLQIRGASLALYDGANQTVQMSYTGDDVWFGSSASDKRFQWDGDSLKINNSSGTAVIQLDNDGSSYFAGVMTIGTSGEVRQGTGTLGSNYTGLRIWRDTGVGRIAGYNNDVQQWYGDTNGKLYAGAGSIFLDADGATLLADITATHDSQVDAKAITFKRSGGTLVGRLTSYYLSGSDAYGLDIYTRAPDTEDAFATIGAEQASKVYAGGAAGAPRLVAYSAASGTDYLRLYGENIDIYTDSSSSPSVEFGTSSVTFNQAVNVTGTLAVTGSITVTGNVDGVDIGAFKTAYDSHTHSYLPLSGGTLTGTLTSRTIAPSANNTYDVGSSSNYFNYAYIRNLVVDTVVGTPSYSHTHSASDITSGTLDAARIPDNYVLTAGDTMSGALVMDADTGVTSNYIRFLTQTSSGKAWDLIGRAHDYATSAQQNDLLLTYYDGSNIYVALQFDSATRIADFLNTPTVGGTAVSLSTHDHSGVYVPVARTVTAGAGLTGGGALSSNITISHEDTSSQASVTNTTSFIKSVGLDTYGHVTSLASDTLQGVAPTLYLGARFTSGTLDFNDVSNTMPNSGYSLLQGSATNGPGGSAYFHTMNFEYADTKAGTGNVTQMAVPYGLSTSIAAGFYYRGRFSGTWGSWYKVWTETNDGPSSGLDADTVDGIQGANILLADGSVAGSTSGVQVFTNGVKTARLSPITDGTTALLVRKASDNTILMTFDTTNGWFGIGGTPGLPLDVHKAGVSATIDAGSDYEDVMGFRNANGRGLRVGANDTVAYLRTTYNGNDFAIATRAGGNNLERLRIKSTGNVLINTTTDAGYTLDVNGTMSAATSVIVPTVTTASGNLSLTSTGGTVAVTGALTVSSTATMTGNVTSPDYASQTTGWRIDSQGGADFRYVYTDQLHAKAFIADLEQALAGGQIITKSVTILHSAFVAPMAGQAATLKVKDLPSAPGMQVFQSGDIVRLRTFDRSGGGLSIADCWGVVTSPSDNADGTQNWTFTRSGTATYSTIAHRDTQTRTQSSSTTNVLTKPTGTASGDVMIASIAYVGSPTITVPSGWSLFRTEAATGITLAIYTKTAGGSEGSSYTWTFSPATNTAAAISGYTNCYIANPIGASNSQSNSSSTSMSAPQVSPGSNAGMLLFIGGVSDNTRATPPASMTERADAGSSGAGIYVADQLLASNAPTGTKTATLASSETTAGALVVLMPNYTAMSTEAGAMTPYSTVNADAIVLDYGTTGNGFHEVNAIDGTYAANSPYSQIVTWTTHPATGSAVRTRTGNLNGVGIADYGMVMGTSVGSAATRSFDFRSSDGSLTLGTVAASKPNLKWDGTAGTLSLRSNTTDVITMDSTGSSYFAGVMTIGTSGEIRQGTGTLGVNYTGLRIWQESGIGRIGGYNSASVTPQWQAGSDGKLYAGGGNARLDTSGVTISSSGVDKIQLSVTGPALAIGATLPSYASGTGIWAGIDSSVAKLRIGTTAGQRLTWDGTTLLVTGQIVVTGGYGISQFTDADLDNIANTATSSKVSTTIIASGLIQVGSGTKDSSLNGWHISSTEIVGQASGADQVVLGTSGKITAGAGNTILDAGGLLLITDTTATHSSQADAKAVSFARSGNSPFARLTSYYVSGTTTYGLDLYARSPNTEKTYATFGAEQAGTSYGGGSAGAPRIVAYSDAASTGDFLHLYASTQIALFRSGSASADLILNSSGLTINTSIDMNTNDITDVNTIASQSQTISPTSTSTKGLVINAVSGATVVSQEWKINNVQRAYVNLGSAISQLGLSAYDNGSGVGPSIIVDRNSNGSTPAAGNIRLTNRGGTDYYIWPDASANLRIGSSVPTSANDTSGTVIGTQSSSLASKNVLGEFTDYGAALRAIVDAPLYDFTYKSGAFNGEQFTGIITDYAPTFGMDGGKSLNEITAHGYSMAAIKALHCKIQALEAQVAELQSR